MGRGEEEGLDSGLKEGGELREAEEHSSSGPDPPPSWSLRRLCSWGGWCSLAPVAAVWAVCQQEAPLLTSLALPELCWRVVLVCGLWLLMGAGLSVLRARLEPAAARKTFVRSKRQVATERRKVTYTWTSRSRGSTLRVSPAQALADSLLLCVLQEPLQDTSVPQILTLLSRLNSVSRSLELADLRSEGGDQSAAVCDRVKLILTYLQDRIRTLHQLLRAQGDLEVSVKDMLDGLEDLWAQLEELHAGVTLTKEGSEDQVDLGSALTRAETLFSVLGQYRSRLDLCQNHLKESTQLLQELTWSHSHMGSSSESMWPELLLQSNMEQFDKVQESFLSLEQQTATFQAHLVGLGRAHHDSLASSSPSSSQDPPHPPEPAHGPWETDGLRSLCERSALQFSSTIGRLRRSSRRKK
ncbi:uncharacterized protein si:ch211-151h10.2 isoform X1 [Synchiropus splendidus]|uniref:uncharacterized protein si:ch211-151h10.2 isoform X1 n=1 Tax=Synchiropus splendidus TaxID=270530 RepID=UPI00237DB6F2|nr:uncharacterized protein si:ch211-151h10.2 isoform X1 [Synchiropus splendidus]